MSIELSDGSEHGEEPQESRTPQSLAARLMGIEMIDLRRFCERSISEYKLKVMERITFKRLRGDLAIPERGFYAVHYDEVSVKDNFRRARFQPIPSFENGQFAFGQPVAEIMMVRKKPFEGDLEDVDNVEGLSSYEITRYLEEQAKSVDHLTGMAQYSTRSARELFHRVIFFEKTPYSSSTLALEIWRARDYAYSRYEGGKLAKLHAGVSLEGRFPIIRLTTGPELKEGDDPISCSSLTPEEEASVRYGEVGNKMIMEFRIGGKNRRIAVPLTADAVLTADKLIPMRLRRDPLNAVPEYDYDWLIEPLEKLFGLEWKPDGVKLVEPNFDSLGLR